MSNLNWKWVALAGVAVLLLVGALLVVALTDVTVEQSIALITGVGGWLVGLFGPRKSREDAARAKAKKAAKDTSKTRRGTSALIVLAVLLVCSGCGASALQTHARAADAMGRVTNAATGELETVYEAEQMAAVEDACGTTEPEEATEPCRAEARAGTAEVRDTWDPVWASHDQVRTVHDSYRETLQLAAAGDLDDPVRWARLAARLVRAYETLVHTAQTVADVRLPPPPGLLSDAAALLVGDRS